MKNIISYTLLSLTFLTSCVSTKVSIKNNFDYSILKPNYKYIIETKDSNKIRAFVLMKVTDSLIIGHQEKDVNKEIIIYKNDINKIMKTSPAKTISLVLVTVGLAVITPAFIQNKPVGQ